MFKRFPPLAVAGALLSLACLAAAPAQALSLVTFVSGKGADSGACASPASPCRSFQFAINQTSAFGEIKALDPAHYGGMVITKSISITGIEGASINRVSGDAITINAGPNDVINLSHLILDGLKLAKNGVLLNSGGNLAMENCVIRNFTNGGVVIAPLGSTPVTGVLRKVITNNNDTGIQIAGSKTGALNVTIVESEASHNHSIGISAGGAGPAAVVMVRNVVVSNNDVGIETNSSEILRIAHSVITGNRFGVVALSGMFSYGDNDIDGNTDDNTGALELIPMH